MSRGRGRGRGRVRFGGSHDSMLADIMDETREDLGLSYAQMEMLHVRPADRAQRGIKQCCVSIVLFETGREPLMGCVLYTVFLMLLSLLGGRRHVAVSAHGAATARGAH